ncbi:Single-stranded-DNA-specific exonuclease RecJ [Aliiroseovarius sp. xm-m-379]|nr:Single-stranded-DNA-specific exonuclease RecJ [Aliiroseovarius sp. xm-d-517]NRP24641.1 Single-stranded-DNA-specific exonuclease RecJ [Aliiroseovarius sp. xm-m-379]NRP30725.1 Single-stranded-DNA-specific exonuclease RecJ [Aliiroseovarius sp. xm-m-314]NRP33440.1 Single-stranded-DNA-specific exonuclease RecJ [Aliiroseovarius sp. xm-a-104]NRP40547.1 Single-stranded-DNA-specific exonuclease RecJ [Aliiroseovarius sp. xm-m-339-2]NRP44639.1 Single-stranded-DNA-specific exonuclease RecJ [Aliiroseova
MTAPGMSFLGVDSSATGRRWVGPGIEAERQGEHLHQLTQLPLPLCKILAQRGIGAEGAAEFLDPTLKALLPDPRGLKDMEIAASRTLQAFDQREKVAVFADYDVDGATSAALLINWFRQMGRDVTLYIPDRIDEGYGPNVPAMELLAADHSLIICVDCGTLSHEPIAAAKAKGADVVVLDHHLGGETLPPAVAVVNPNRQDELDAPGYLCAAGVVFLMLVELGRMLREAGRTGPDLISMLDLVALGTVADVAPLIEANRALVRQGLKIMARRARPGMVALADVSGMNEAPRAYHLGYMMGPRVNAGGRVGRADLGARLLSTMDMHEAQAIAARLNDLNAERREIEANVQALALEQAEARGLDAPLVWAAGEGWHPGVVGIVASRLKEATNRPAVVIGFDGNDGKGSGRSIAGVDLGASIQRLASDGDIQKGGGHKMAAGLSLSRDQLEPAMNRLSDLLAKQGAGLQGAADLRLDGVLMPSAVTVDLIEELEQAGPFGASAPAPRFAFPDVQILFAKRVGQNHLKLSFGDGMGTRIDAISFGAFDGPLGPLLENHAGRRFHLAGKLEVNHWQGRSSPQLRLDDASTA